MNNNKKRIYIIENEDGFKFSEKKRVVSFNRVAFLFFLHPSDLLEKICL